ncbi:hypothetical protein Tco_1228833 [Tanacetum coccineum]
MAERLQAEEQEQFTIEEKATLFKELLEQRRKHFAAKRAEEKRNKPPTKTQQKKIMITYLKNMEGWKHKDLKSKDFDSIKELFDKAFTRVNMFVDFRTELVEGSSKRAGEELEQESTKKQKVDEDKDTAELQSLMEVIPDEEEVAIDVVPLATKSPSIVDWKIHKEGKKSYYQIVRADGKSQIPNYATYPEDGVVAGSYEVSREEWNGPYQLTLSILTKEVFKDPRVCKTVVDQFPIPREMVRIEALTDDRLAGKMSVLHYMMMSHRGELLARYRGLLKSHHKYVPSTYSRLKGFQQRLTSFQGLKSQVFGLKKQVTDLNDKITASDAAFVKAKAKGKPGGLMLKKDIRLPPLKVTLVLVQKLLASDEFSRVQGDLLSLASSAGFERRLTVVPAPRVAGVSPPFTKELIVTHAPSLVELFSKDATPSYTTTSEQNKEWLSVMGVAHPVCKDVNRVESSSIQELGFASSGSANVLIALSVGEKEHGSPHSSDVLVTASADAGDAVAALFGV